MTVHHWDGTDVVETEAAGEDRGEFTAALADRHVVQIGGLLGGVAGFHALFPTIRGGSD